MTLRERRLSRVLGNGASEGCRTRNRRRQSPGVWRRVRSRRDWASAVNNNMCVVGRLRGGLVIGRVCFRKSCLQDIRRSRTEASPTRVASSPHFPAGHQGYREILGQQSRRNTE